jgi:uncharacterized repeat protein (TIGR02543 family)
MKHCAKKLLGFAFALALCLAVGGTALAETPEQEMLAYEPNVTAEPGTNTTGNLATDGYQVTIPTTVEVKSGEDKGTLEVKAQLKQYRTLNIGIASNNKWKLAYDDTTAADTPKVDYTLSEGTSDDVPADCEWQYQPDTKTLSFSTTKMQPGTSLEEDMKRVRSSSYELPITVPTPSQATMSGTYSDTVSFEFDLTKQCVTYFINVYEQELKLTNSGTHVQAVDVVDANGNVIGDPTPKLTQTFEYPLQNEDHRWTYSSDDPEDDKLRWEELPTATMNADRDNKAGKTNVTFNLNLKRKWYWLDVNGITNKETCTKCETDGNQGGRIAGFVNIKVSVDDGTNWSDWFWYSDGDDYWGTFPYGTEFQLGLHRVKDGYAYDEENGKVAIYANDTLAYTQDTDISLDKRTNYRVYKGKLEGEPVDKTLHPTKWGGISHAAGSYPRYCYNVCFVDGITYYANGGTGGREDTNAYHGAHTTFQYTAGMTLADPLSDELTGCKFTAPDGKEFAGWSTTKDYTAGQPLYAAGADVSSVTTWPTRPGTSNHDTLPTGDGQTVCRTLYAIWKKPYTVKVQFGGIIGWTTWDAANQSFPEKLQGGDKFDEPAVELGTAYAYGNTSLTLSATENKTVWNALQAKIEAKTTEIATAVQPDAVWQLKNEYTTTRLPANGEVTIQIKRKRYLLNVIPALDNGDGTYSPVSNATDAEQYGTFRLKSCGAEQTQGGKVSYYQHMRNYGGSYEIYDVKANAGYLFVGFERPTDKGPTTTDGTGNLTGKNTDIHYFGDSLGREYTGDTIYVMYKKDMVTFDYNGGTTGDGATKQVLPYDDTIRFPKVVLTHPNNVTHIGWSTEKNPDSDDKIFKLTSAGNVLPEQTTVSSKVKNWPNPNNKVLYAVWRSTTGPNRAPAKKALTVRYHANFDPNEELALDLDPDPLLDDLDDTFGFDPDPLLEDVDDALEGAVKTVSYQPGEDVVLRNCMFKRSGYVFVGWNTEPDGTGRLYRVNGVPITDWAAGDTVDLYAQWKKPDHLKPVVDNEPFVPTDPDTPPEELDPGFGIDPDADPADEEGPADDADAVDDAPAVADEEAAAAPPEELDFGFGIDPDAAMGGPAPFVRW